MKHLLSSLVCLLLLAGIAPTQPPVPSQEEIQEIMRQQMTRYIKSPSGQLSQKAGDTADFRRFWDGSGADIWTRDVFFSSPDVRKAWDISDEQFQKIKDATQITITVGQEDPRFANNPEYKERSLALQAELDSIQRDDHYLEHADEETKARFQYLHEQKMLLDANYDATLLDMFLTPEQKQKMKEFQIATIPEMPMFAPSMLEALDLTEQQKEQMEEIKKALEPELEKTLEEIARRRGMLINKHHDASEKYGVLGVVGQNLPPETAEAIAKILRADADFWRIREEKAALRTNFSNRFKVELFDVLTDAQWDKFQDLIDNPPEYIKAWLKIYPGREQTQEAWQPGPNSWQPGDAIPDGYRRERNSRGNFPRPQ